MADFGLLGDVGGPLIRIVLYLEGSLPFKIYFCVSEVNSIFLNRYRENNPKQLWEGPNEIYSTK